MKFTPPFSDREKHSIWILAAAVVLFFIENTYFGWNKQASSAAEAISDFLVIALLILAWLWKPSRVDNTTINRFYRFSRMGDETVVEEEHSPDA